MSKSKGNLIAPTKYFDTVGADALRLFHLFAGPPGDDMDWSAQTDEIIEGCARFLDRVWRLTVEDDRTTGRRARVRPTAADVGGDPVDAPADRQGQRRHGAMVVQHRGGRLHGVRQRTAALPARRRPVVRTRPPTTPPPTPCCCCWPP